MNVAEMNKGELQAYAKKEFGVDLDMRKSVENLVKEVETLTTQPAKTNDKTTTEKSEPTHLLNKTTGFWFEYTHLLAKRGDLVPCDSEGKPV